MTETTQRRIEKTLKDMKKARGQFDQLFQQAAEMVLPHKANFTTETMPGQKRTRNLYDSTAIQANEVFASSLHGMMINYNAEWFRIESNDQETNKNKDVAQYFDNVTEKMHAAIHDPAANFTSQLDEVFLDIGIGNGILTVQPGKRSRLQFKSWCVTDTYFLENEAGRVEFIAKEENCTSAINILTRYQEDGDSVPDWLSKIAAKTPQEDVKVIHAIMRRDYFNPNTGDTKDKEYAYYHILAKDLHILRESGFDYFPASVGRWRKESTETYGRGPAIIALPDILTVNEMQKQILAASEKTLNPPMHVPSNTYLGRVKSYAGALNFAQKTGSGDRIEPLYTVGNIPNTVEIMERIQLHIRTIFFNDQLQLAQGPDMTAFEVATRTNEKMRLMMPMLGRIQSELIAETLQNAYLIMQQAGDFGRLPEALIGRDIEIRYLSNLAKAQQSADSEAIMQGYQQLALIAQVDPTVFDLMNHDESGRTILTNLYIPAESINSKEEVNEKRKQRQQQLQQQAMIAAQQGGATGGNGTGAAPAAN